MLVALATLASPRSLAPSTPRRVGQACRRPLAAGQQATAVDWAVVRQAGQQVIDGDPISDPVGAWAAADDLDDYLTGLCPRQLVTSRRGAARATGRCVGSSVGAAACAAGGATIRVAQLCDLMGSMEDGPASAARLDRGRDG